MQLIKNMEIVDAKNDKNEGIMINTLNGNISILSADEKDTIKKWQQSNNINPDNDSEQILFESLVSNGYLVKDYHEEQSIEKHVFEICKSSHVELMQNSGEIVLVLTYKCNFACPYCYEDAKSYKRNIVMTMDMVDKIFALQTSDLKNISLYGGEPLLPETRSIIEYIISKKPDVTYHIITNGYYLVEFIDVLKKMNLSNIMVTLDGPEEIHNKTRILKNGKKTYSKIMQGIELCLKNKIAIKIRMNISPQNIDQCLKLRDELIQEYLNEYFHKLLIFELQPIFQSSFEVRNNLNEKLFFSNTSPHGNPYKYNVMALSMSHVLKNFVNSSKKTFRPKYCFCDAEGRRLFYDPEGKIYSCILSLKNEKASVGTYYPEFLLKKNSIFTRTIETIEKCRDCKFKFICGGGCAYSVLNSEGDVMKPNCYNTMYEIYNELPYLYRKFTNYVE